MKLDAIEKKNKATELTKSKKTVAKEEKRKKNKVIKY
jgi:hypothetical protein